MRRQSIVSPERDLFSKARRFGLLSVLLALFTGAACSSGGGDAGPPMPPIPPSIGPAGGTVNGQGGSSIVVPANALAANTFIAISQSSTASPALPVELEPAGDMYAITPHGTAFAVAATVTIPFDPADVPAGRTVQLMKTNAAQNGWESVAGATASGNTLSAQTSSLSWWLAALVAVGPTITTEPADITVNAGQSATFEVIAEANGAVVSFQWRRNDVDTPGATTSTYSLQTTTVGDDGARFSVLVENAFGSVLSGEALLTVVSDVPSGWTQIGGNLIEGAIDARNRVRYPSIAVHTDGTIYVAYAVHSSVAPSLQGFLRVSKWDPISEAWSSVGEDLNIGADTDWAPEWPFIRVGSDGNPVIAWVNRWIVVQNTSFTNEIVVQKWSGTTWERIGGAPSGVSGGALRASAPILALGTSSTTVDLPYVAFSEGICNVFRAWDGNDTWLPTDPQRACAASNQSGLALAVNNVNDTNNAFVAGSPVPPPPMDGNGNFTELRNWISVRYRGAQDSGFFNSQLGGGPANAVRAEQIGAAGLTVDDFGLPIIVFSSSDFLPPHQVTMTVRQWTPGAWVTLGGDLLQRDPLVPPENPPAENQPHTLVTSVPHLRIERALAAPVVAWLTGTAAEARITGRTWDGQAWREVPPPHESSTNIGHFGFTIAPDDDRMHVAFTERVGTPGQDVALYVRTCDAACF